MSTSGHRRHDERSLALHRAVASAIRRDPTVIQKALANISRWEQLAPGPWLAEWRAVLTGPLETLLALLESPDKNAVRLRQSSPFTGVLSEAERRRIYESHAD